MSEKVLDIRKEIDALDDKVHDLLMKRAELVVKIGEEKRKNNVQVVQPDREAVMLRRLLARHKGPLPLEAVVRIWRELVGAVSLLQTGLKVVVTVPEDHTGLIYWDMAKDYFSSVLPMQKAGNVSAALAMVREGEATFGVLPRPQNEEKSPWWRYLMNEEGEKAMRIMARLPLGDRASAGQNPDHQALVIARLKFEPSGDDRSFIALELEEGISRAKIVDKLRALKLEPRNLYSSPGRDGQSTMHLAEVDGYVGVDDPRLTELLSKLDSVSGKVAAVGGYATPPAYK